MSEVSADNGELRIIRASDFENWQPSPEYTKRIERAKALTDYARKLTEPPKYEAGNRVKRRGERLSRPIYWKGRQWAVTRFGVECRDGLYVIAKDRIWENDDKDYGGWVRHMSAKVWADLDDFAEALRIARRRENFNQPKSKA